MSYQNFGYLLPLRNALFRARLTSVYTLTSTDVSGGHSWAGMTAGTNIYAFVEETCDPATGLPVDANPGRQSYPAGSSTPTSGFAIEVNNANLTVPGSTPTGYTNAGPYVWMRLRETVLSVPVYEFQVPPLSYLSATCANYTMTSSWANVGLSLSLNAGSVWLVQTQLNGQITSSGTGAGDSFSFRYYDGSTVYGAPVECCEAICASLSFMDAAALIAIVTVGNGNITLNVQGKINTSTGSTGTLFGTSNSQYGSNLAAVRLA